MTGQNIIRFTHDGLSVDVAMTVTGSGPSILLLPALSSISTREEMAGLAQHLAQDFRVHTVDWPGFGTVPRPRAEWTSDILSAFFGRIMNELRPQVVVAAGHAASYAVYHLARHQEALQGLVLIAPTWRGPLPTMMGGQRAWFGRIRAAVDSPIMGPMLYAANVSSFVVKRMVREHVYSDASWLSDERLREKMAVARGKGARHASVRFVTGALDRFPDREAFLEDIRAISCPILMIYGAETPRRSRAEMEALADLPNVESERLEFGKLSIHEEFPDRVAPIVARFLAPS
ncbi:alpha/beta hydrolase [Rhizobium sp. P44RR-XXIV]|uniref:alpha/beta fold hydrolase n=1 Tax=Rhizobium sp. P44RR-XXIV TaxID=1921145 RepID=UPI000985214D|nr:alpha/beta hydrolase [Rhizobium sp. P44RR-XXIV]TIX93109.1 alpha/beta hydrolase [Rhizobium sp. P44RR-XXIV]